MVAATAVNKKETALSICPNILHKSPTGGQTKQRCKQQQFNFCTLCLSLPYSRRGSASLSNGNRRGSKLADLLKKKGGGGGGERKRKKDKQGRKVYFKGPISLGFKISRRLYLAPYDPRR